MKTCAALGLLLICACACAQEFVATGKLETPARDGFYKILLSPQEAPYLNLRVTNVRVLDSRNSEVPYILQEEQPLYVQEQFKEYEIIEKKQVANSLTSIVLHNPTQEPIDNISLLIKNAEVSKTARLSGSDDRAAWFAVKENFPLGYINGTRSVNELRAIEFPRTNYRYYLLEISDSTSSPINVLKAGYYDATSSRGMYSEITESFTLTTETKSRKTFITIRFQGAQLVDKLELSLKGTPFFQRTGKITTATTRNVKKRVEQFDENIATFIVRSGQTAVTDLDGIKTDNMTLVIENGDNPVLSIEDIKIYQLNRYLVTWLKKGETYTVGFGAENLSHPEYDLAYFRDSIPANPQILKISEVEVAKAVPVADSGLFNNKTIAWIAIVLVILLLGIMSFRLVRETNASPKPDS